MTRSRQSSISTIREPGARIRITSFKKKNIQKLTDFCNFRIPPLPDAPRIGRMCTIPRIMHYIIIRHKCEST